MILRAGAVVCLLASRGLGAAAEDARPTVAVTVSVAGRLPSDGDVLTDLVMAKLSVDPRWQLVERTQLAAVEHELAAAASGLDDAATAARLGSLVHADVVLECRLMDSGDYGGKALVSAVDATSAETLASQTVALGQRPDPAWLRAPSPGAINALASAARNVLVGGAQRLASSVAWPQVLPLYVRVASPGDDPGNFSGRLFQALNARATARHVRLLHSPSFSGANGENRLAAVGLTTGAGGTGPSVANRYIWGLLVLHDTATASVQIWRWSGAGRPERREFQGPTGDVSTLAASVSDFAFDGLSAAVRPMPGARQSAAPALLAEARRIGLPDMLARPLSPAAHAQFAQIGALVSAAAFFAPQSRTLEELRVWLEVRQTDEPAELNEASAQYRRLALEQWKVGDRLDLAVVQRAFESWGETSIDKNSMIQKVAQQLANAKAEDLAPWKMLFGEFFMNLWFQRDDPTATATLEMLWPALQAAVPDEFGPEVVRGPKDWRHLLPDFYHGDSQRARALMSRLPSLPPAAGAVTVAIVASPSPELLLGGPSYADVVLDPSPLPVSRAQGSTSAAVGAPLRSPRFAMAPTHSAVRPDPSGPVVLVGDGTRQLCDELTRGTLERFQALLDAGADPLQVGDPRSPALALAALNQRWDFVELILDRHVDLSRPRGGILPDRTVSVGGYALYEAIYFKQFGLAQRLMDLGARPDGTPYSAPIQPFLAAALYAGDEDIMKRVIALGAVPKLNEQLLVRAVEYRSLAGLRLILPYAQKYEPSGAEFDPRYNESSQALVAAVEARWKQGVELLVAAGTCRTAVDRNGTSVAELAADDPEISALLLNRPVNPAALSGAAAVAAATRHDPVIESLVLTDAVIHYQDARGWSLLHHACYQKEFALALRLVRAGAPLNILSKKGQSPLAFAANAGDDKLVAAMLAAGADPNLSGDGDEASTPLQFAAYGGNLAIVNLLLRAGADPRKPSLQNGVRPLLAACNHPDCVPILKALVSAGASYEDVDNIGLGALEYAIFSDDPAIIQYLLDQGVAWRPPTPSDPSYTPFRQAVRYGKEAVAQKLIALGKFDAKALPLAKTPGMRALIEDAALAQGNRVVDDQELWPSICRDLQRGFQRAEALVAKGGDPNYRTQQWTPLLLAFQERNMPLAKWLLTHGANPRLYPLAIRIGAYDQLIPNVGSMYPSAVAVRDDDVAEVVGLLYQAGLGKAASYNVILAVQNGWPHAAKALLATGVSRDEVLAEFNQAFRPSLPPAMSSQLERSLSEL